MDYNSEIFNKYRDFQPPWGPIGLDTFRRSYPRKKPDGKMEVWPESAVRTVLGNTGLVDPKYIEEGEREKLIDLLLPFGILPAGRHLTSSGVQGKQFLFNCHAAGWDYEDPAFHFGFSFDQLMQMGGVGSNYSNRYLEKMPKVQTRIDLHIVCDEEHPNRKDFEKFLVPHNGNANYHRVSDDREGWVEAVLFVVREAFKASESGEKTLTVDVSGVREKGAELKGIGGIASGPEPLVEGLYYIARHLGQVVERKLTSMDAMWLDHYLAGVVVAGGKRRSSRMSVKSWKDNDIFEFINAKSQDHDMWTTNISVEIDDDFLAAYKARDLHAVSVMREVIRAMRVNGEPGFWNRSLAQRNDPHPEQVFAPNPCGEIALYMWENCNLGHINLAFFALKDEKEMFEAFRLMTRWLIRATFGDIPQAKQREVVNRNRRIGVGFLGFHNWISHYGIKYSEAHNHPWVIRMVKEMKNTVLHEAYRYSQSLGIPLPIANTALAPTGTISLLPGVSSSAQAIYAPRNKRLMRYAGTDPELAVKRMEGYPVRKDKDAWDTWIVEYWAEDPLLATLRAHGLDESVVEAQSEVPMENQLALVAMLQREYADNAISYTINVHKDDLMGEHEHEKLFAEYLPQLKGMTMYVEGSRDDAPFQVVSKEEWDAYTGPKEVAHIEQECKGGCPVV